MNPHRSNIRLKGGRPWLPMLGMVACLALAPATRATVLPFVTNTTSGVGLLADGFENQTLGAGFPTTALMSPFVTGSSW